MKNQYFGDINDYRKYGLLRCFSEVGFSVGVCWMLTAPDGGGDGGKTTYLAQPRLWQHRDPALFDFLKQSVEQERRHVTRFEESDLLPRAKFYTELLTDEESQRALYFAGALGALGGADVLFFDPDTGLEVSSVPRGRVESSRYLYWAEVEQAGRLGASLIVFQHWRRENRLSLAERLSAELMARMPPDTSVVAIHTDFVLFLCACIARHREAAERAFALVGRRWSGDLVLHDSMRPNTRLQRASSRGTTS